MKLIAGHHRTALTVGLSLSLGTLFSVANASAAPQKRRRTQRMHEVQPSQAKGRIVVTVVDISANLVFIEPGESDGLTQGAWVNFGGNRYKIEQTTSESAVIKAAPGLLRMGDEGIVQSVVSENDDAQKPLRAETSSSDFVSSSVPASEQTPTFVPLSGGSDIATSRSAQQLMISAGVTVTAPTALGIGPIVRSEVRGRGHFEPLSGSPLHVDIDAAVQKWSGRDIATASDSRPLLRVYQAEIGYGSPDMLGASLGRLRYAASTLGALDGVRVQTGGVAMGQTSKLHLSAFGGMVPDPASNAVSSKATRFGAEAMFQDLDQDWTPTATLVAHGSLYQGQIDERRINGSFYLYPERGRLGGFFEVDFFDQNNPWQAPTTDLAAGGIDASWLFGNLSLGLRADMRKPERSRWLASYFPQGYFCIAQAPTVSSGEGTNVINACGDYNVARYALTLDARLTLDDLMLSSATSVVASGHETEPQSVNTQLGARLGRVLDVLFVDVSGMVVRGTWLNNDVLRASLGFDAFDHDLEASIYYRPAWVRYHRVTDEAWMENTVGAQLYLALNTHLSLQTYAELVKGYDVGVLLLQSYLTWRL